MSDERHITINIAGGPATEAKIGKEVRRLMNERSGAMRAVQRERGAQAPEAATRAAAEADLAHRMQRWPRRIFRQELEEGGQLATAVSQRQEPSWEAFTRELFGRLYNVGIEPLDEPRDGAEWAHELHRQADAVPEWTDLAGRVDGDPWRAGVGAATAAKVLADKVPYLPEEDAEQLQAEIDTINEFIERQGGGRRVNQKVLGRRADLQRRVAKARAQAEHASGRVKARDGVPIRSALRQAARDAAQAVEETEEGIAALGAGDDPGQPTKRKIAARMAEDERLRRIAVMAGRLRTAARQKQRMKPNRERDEVHGVTTGDDVQYLLGSEVGLLTRPETRPLLMARVAEKRALQYQLRGRERRNRGPIVFAIDTSGSMSGHREEWAKACALAMMEVARIQKRGFAVLYYHTEVYSEFRFDPENADLDALLDCLGTFSSGGTNIVNALHRAADVVSDGEWRPGRDADVVLVSDGDDHSDVASAAARIRDAGAHLYTIGIDCGMSPDVESASDEVVRISSPDMRDASTPKLDGVLSV